MEIRQLKWAALPCLLFASYSAIGAGFQLSEHSANGVGRANAGEAAIADSAAVIASNPAAITRFDSSQLSFGTSYLMPNVRVTGNGPSDEFNRQLTNNDLIDNVFVPSLYFTSPINQSWSWGIGLFTDFGLTTEYPDDYLAGTIGGETSLETFNINPTLAYRFNQHWSLGIGGSAVYGKAKLTRTLGILAPALNSQLGTNLSNTDTAASLDGDGWGYGFNVGVLWEINDNNRFGLSYRSPIDLKLEGDYDSDIPSELTGTQAGKLTLNLPSISEFSGYHQLTSSFALHYSVMMTQWDSFKDIDAKVNGSTVLYKEENFENAFKYALGATYWFTRDFSIRAGVAYDQTPNVNNVSISLPDSDRMNYSLGASYAFNSHHRVDFGFTYIDAEEGTFEEGIEPQSLPGTQFAFKSQGDIYIAAVQYNYSF